MASLGLRMLGNNNGVAKGLSVDDKGVLSTQPRLSKQEISYKLDTSTDANGEIILLNTSSDDLSPFSKVLISINSYRSPYSIIATEYNRILPEGTLGHIQGEIVLADREYDRTGIYELDLSTIGEHFVLRLKLSEKTVANTLRSIRIMGVV